jgi:hypothetical protein
VVLDELVDGAVEGEVSGDHLEEHDAEGVEVAGRAARLAAGELGGEVLGGAEDLAGHGEAHLAAHVHDAEVEHLHAQGAGGVAHEEDVLGLHVAVHDAERVRAAEGVADGDGDLDGLAHAHGARLHALREALALEEFHDEEDAVALLGDVPDVDDVGVAEEVGGLRLAHEALAHDGVAGELGGEQLERDVVAQDDVARAVDRAHAPGADAAEDLVPRREGAADHGVGRGLEGDAVGGAGGDEVVVARVAARAVLHPAAHWRPYRAPVSSV